MNLILIKPSKEYQSLIVDMLDEWTKYNASHPEANGSPRAIFCCDYHDFDNYIEYFKRQITDPEPNRVAATTYFALDLDNNIIVGACQIRHYLNESLRFEGGHVGDGIRPSCRNKGYGKEILRLALKECKKLGIKEVMISCNKDNIASKKCILFNGGIFENEVLSEGELIENYWIYCK